MSRTPAKIERAIREIARDYPARYLTRNSGGHGQRIPGDETLVDIDERMIEGDRDIRLHGNTAPKSMARPAQAANEARSPRIHPRPTFASNAGTRNVEMKTLRRDRIDFARRYHCRRRERDRIQRSCRGKFGSPGPTRRKMATFDVGETTAKLPAFGVSGKTEDRAQERCIIWAMATVIEIGSLISRHPDIRGGRPCIAGTGVSIRRIAQWYNMGLIPEEIARKFGHLSLAQVHAALAYYHANQTEIDPELEAEARETEALQQQHRR